MKFHISIPVPGERNSFRLFSLSFNSCFERIDYPGVVILDIVKCHDHRYDLIGFFYERKVIVGPYSFRSKKDLHGAIQNLLQEFLDFDVQNESGASTLLKNSLGT